MASFRKEMVLYLYFIGVLLVAGCAGTPEILIDSEKGLFTQAVKYFEDEDYKKAQAAFQKLKDNYPLSKYSITAELRIADSLYHQRNYQEAIFQYEEFRKLHPTNKAIPYVMYQVGMSHFDQALSIDRDQASTENAVKQFEHLISRYPSDPYAASARERLQICQEKLAGHEFYVAYFYFKTEKYSAALQRLSGILTRFPESSIADKTYLHVGKCHLHLKDIEKAANAFRHLLKNYPNSEYYDEAFILLQEIS